MNHIELFAGCGGLSLGLEGIGSELIMANEMSPMAAQTFAYNFFSEDFEKTNYQPTRTMWLSSNYSLEQFDKRLREDPRDFPEYGRRDGNYDIKPDDSLEGKLVVGNIIQLNEFLDCNESTLKDLKNSYGRGELDLVSGGPPCQSFSMAGLRNKDCDKNSLPWEFAKFVEKVQPRFTLLENVTGILRAFQECGKKYYAWVEVAKAFCEKNYVPLCLHINAKFVGVPQNRPRFIMIGVRKDIFDELRPTFNRSEQELFSSSEKFYDLTDNGYDTNHQMIKCHEINKRDDIILFMDSFLKHLVSVPRHHVTVSEAIDDLRFNGKKSNKSEHLKDIASIFSSGRTVSRNNIKNHGSRGNNHLVQRRFRLYQVMQIIGNGLSKEVREVLKGATSDIRDEAWLKFSQFDYLTKNKTYEKFNNKAKFIEFLQQHSTKKQTQKALDANIPAPAALSIPDDACHYHHDELRTLTVREMARIQSFPDTFEFKSKVTTGGQMRKFEVPQYTQVGNAVPPLLGRALGLTIQELRNRLK